MIIPCRYQDAPDEVRGDHLITDGPYGKRTHKGHDSGGPQILSATGQATRRTISYAPWTAEDVREYIRWSADRVTGWRACMTSHDLVSAYEEAYREIGLYSFAPVAIILPRPRLLGDGPASWLIYLMVARPRTQAFSRWRCLPGMYRSSCERGVPVVGAKRLELMADIIRDYANEGDTIVDGCAGAGSTNVAAYLTGRGSIGCEQSPELAEYANARLARAVGGEIVLKEEPKKARKEREAIAADEADAPPEDL